MTGTASSPLNKKPSSFKQTYDSQPLDAQALQLFGLFLNEYIKRNRKTFIDQLKNLYPELTVSAPTISNTYQGPNLVNDTTYHITNQIGCLKPEFLHEIFTAFYTYSLTNIEQKDFTPHFIGELKSAQKIIWLRGANLLTFTFRYLMGKLIPYYDNPFVVIAEHFCDSEGKDYSPEQLRKNHSKGVRDMAKLDMIKKAFSQLIKKEDG